MRTYTHMYLCAADGKQKKLRFTGQRKRTVGSGVQGPEELRQSAHLWLMNMRLKSTNAGANIRYHAADATNVHEYTHIYIYLILCATNNNSNSAQVNRIRTTLRFR